MLKVAIEQLDTRNGFKVSVKDGREFIVETIEEAIKLKEELENDESRI